MQKKADQILLSPASFTSYISTTVPSVPFEFDVHAMIFSEDAPKLEAALHHAFEQNKVNKINSRREFFKVPLEDIKKEVRKNFDKTVEWIDVADAEQYRQSISMK